MPHVCPWWGGFFIDNPLRRLLHSPEEIVGPYVRPEMTVMDVGCGMGLFSIAMTKSGREAGAALRARLRQAGTGALMCRRMGTVPIFAEHADQCFASVPDGARRRRGNGAEGTLVRPRPVVAGQDAAGDILAAVNMSEGCSLGCLAPALVPGLVKTKGEREIETPASPP